jgi:dTMP kinase
MKDIVAAHKGLPRPDLTFILDVPAEVGMARIGKDTNRQKRESFEKLEFQEKLRNLYLGLPKMFPNERFCVIDANRDPKEIELEIIREVWPYLNQVK